MTPPTGERSIRGILARCRIVVGALGFAPLAVAGVLSAVDLRAPVGPLALPAALAGAVAPVVALQALAKSRTRVRPGETLEARGERYLTALLVAVGITEAAALAGALIAEFTGEPLALLGLATHVLLVGLVWPTEERFETFLDERGGG